MREPAAGESGENAAGGAPGSAPGTAGMRLKFGVMGGAAGRRTSWAGRSRPEAAS
jgi:hypothetical protein